MIETSPAPTSVPSRVASLRNAFISGFLMLAPLLATWLVFTWVIDRIGGGMLRGLAPSLYGSGEGTFRGFLLSLLATLIFVALVTAIGYISRYVLGKYFGSLAERFILSIPGFSGVYLTVKQIVATFGTQNRNLFSKVVLVQFPRAGVHTVGFLTSKARGEPQTKAGTEVWTVFVPTSPNPTSGFLLLVPKNEIIELEMSVGDGMKMVISGGAVLPSASAATPSA
jgi:uncharacterized membrane protein